MDDKCVWLLTGLPGVRKTTLFNKLTNQNRPTGAGALSLTTNEKMIEDIMTPVKGLRNIHFVDTVGVGGITGNLTQSDASQQIIGQIGLNLSQQLARVVAGATGVIICLETGERLLWQDALAIKSFLNICPNLPLIFCFLKSDIYQFSNDGASPDDWLADAKEPILTSLALNDADIQWLTMSTKTNGTGKLINVLENYLTTPFASGSNIEKSRQHVQNFKPDVNVAPDIYDKILRVTAAVVETVVRSLWFIELLKAVPFIGTVTAIVDAIMVTLGHYSRHNVKH